MTAIPEFPPILGEAQIGDKPAELSPAARDAINAGDPPPTDAEALPPAAIAARNAANAAADTSPAAKKARNRLARVIATYAMAQPDALNRIARAPSPCPPKFHNQRPAQARRQAQAITRRRRELTRQKRRNRLQCRALRPRKNLLA